MRLGRSQAGCAVECLLQEPSPQKEKRRHAEGQQKQRRNHSPRGSPPPLVGKRCLAITAVKKTLAQEWEANPPKVRQAGWQSFA